MFIFGAGKILDRLYRSNRICWGDVEAVLDNSPKRWGGLIYGKEIKNPVILKERYASCIIIASSKYFNEIFEQLKYNLGVDCNLIRSWSWYLAEPQIEYGYRISSRFTEVTVKSILTQLAAKYVLDITNIFSCRGIESLGRDEVKDLIVDGVVNHNSPVDRLYVANVYRKIHYSCSEMKQCFYDCILLIDAFFKMSLSECKDIICDTYYCSRYVVINLPACPQPYIAEEWHKADFSSYGTISVMATSNDGTFVIIKKDLEPSKLIGMYVVTHKRLDLAANLPKGYKIIFAGAQGCNDSYGYLRDDAGINISVLNKKINECTAIYWLWKHTIEPYIGLCHYRRFFIKDDDATREISNILEPLHAVDYLREYDILLLEQVNVGCVKKQLSDTVNEEAARSGISLIKKVMEKKHPESLKAFDWVMRGSSFWGCNMFIMRRKCFDEYCEWLFSFLIEAAELFKSDAYDSYSQRMIGFLAERMLTVWLLDKNIKVKTLPMLLLR